MKKHSFFIEAERTRCVFEEHGHTIALTSAFQTCSFCFPYVSHSITTIKNSMNTLLLPVLCILPEIYYKTNQNTPTPPPATNIHFGERQGRSLIRAALNSFGVRGQLHLCFWHFNITDFSNRMNKIKPFSITAFLINSRTSFC